MPAQKTVRIGGAAGYWGDSPEAPRQLVEKGKVDYLVLDYLAEVTMSILARAHAKDPTQGYAGDFVDLVMRPLMKDIAARKIKVIANAGGVNLAACAAALAKAAEEAGVHLRIGTVEGDDLLPRAAEFRAAGAREMFTGAPLPEKLASANAYLGAFPIAAALAAGADIVVTGRCADSALVLGPLIHEFGWTAGDLDRLAAGSLAGHILECGAQATGGNFTDWRDVVGGWANMGYPIAEVRADGSFAVTKPEGTGGLVSPLSVGEQILYEIGDPAAYVLPDVVCDFTGVRLTQAGPDRIEVAGARGRPPTGSYKVSATYADGWRATALLGVAGFEAADKARAFADALIARTRRLFATRNLGDYDGTAVHVIGAGTLFGANAPPAAAEAREVALQIDVRHRDRAALEIFSKEATGVALSMTTGYCAVGPSGRPRVMPVVAQFAFLVDKTAVTPVVRVDGAPVPYAQPQPPAPAAAEPEAAAQEAPAAPEGETVEVPLIRLAVARSGDKGDAANIGVMARSPAAYAALRDALTAEKVAAWFAHVTKGEVSRYEAPGLGALNFLLHQSLGGGGTSSLHLDRQAKTYAQQLLAMPVRVPKPVADAHPPR